MAVGRFLCVSLPLILIVASIVATLIAVLAGVVHEDMQLFSVDLKDLSINEQNFKDLTGDLDLDFGDLDLGDLSKVESDISSRAAALNITAKTLGLSDTYDVTLWGYCRYSDGGKRNCTDSKFNWAADTLNTTTLENVPEKEGAKGITIDLPSDIKDALKTFKTVLKWTEVAFIIALIALGVEFVIGIFANFSRAISCLVWLFAGITAALVCAAAALATATAAIVVGAVDATAKLYGVKGHIDGKFLATVWIGAAFAIGAAMFWIFTICCCKPEHRSSRRNKHRSTDGEKLLPAGGYSPRGYAPLENDHEMTGGGFYNHAQPQFDPGHTVEHSAPRYPSGTAARSDLAYEPYSHRA